MKSRLGKLKILSHGSLRLGSGYTSLAKSLIPRSLFKISAKSLTKSISGSIALGLISGLMGGLVSCSSVPNPSNSSQTTPSPATTASPSPSMAASSPSSLNSMGKEEPSPAKTPESAVTKSPESPTSAAKNTVAINIYQVDNLCNDFVAEKVDLPQNNSLDMAIAKVIEKSNINEFSLSSSKVTMDAQGIATIDFQVAANSKRRFISLSSCEQFNLFGSLRKTLIDNPAWQIKDVRFTEGSKEIVF